MRYQICEADSAEALQAEVTRLLAKGWRPVGGVTAVNSNANAGNWWFYQAMVLTEGEADAGRAGDVAPGDPELA